MTIAPCPALRARAPNSGPLRTTGTWAVVLAAGDGARLGALTLDEAGRRVPKQYCSLGGTMSLLGEALARARNVDSVDHVCVVVAEDHERWWSRACRDIAPDDLFVQPRNRGTAHGILLPLVSILARDPGARLLLMPSDHFVRDERALREAIGVAEQAGRTCRDGVVLIGVSPEWPDPELGYILPADGKGSVLSPVRAFVEKPSRLRAEWLVHAGAAWNTFIVSAQGATLLEWYRERMPQAVRALEAIMRGQVPAPARAQRLAALYETLDSRDFSRDILETHPERLLLHVAPPCGWADLGTPARLIQALAHGAKARALHTGQQGAAATVFRGALDLARLVSGAGASPLQPAAP